MKLKTRKAIAIALSFVLTAAFVLTGVSTPGFKSKIYAQTVMMEEEFNTSSWQTNASLFSKSNNLQQGALDPNNTQYQIIAPSDGNEAYLIYKFNSLSGKVFSDINFSFKGRAYTNTYIKFYGSTDNTNYKFLTQLSSATGSDPDANFSTGSRVSDMSTSC
jgi:hypothetical protein